MSQFNNLFNGLTALLNLLVDSNEEHPQLDPIGATTFHGVINGEEFDDFDKFKKTIAKHLMNDEPITELVSSTAWHKEDEETKPVKKEEKDIWAPETFNAYIKGLEETLIKSSMIDYVIIPDLINDQEFINRRNLRKDNSIYKRVADTTEEHAKVISDTLIKCIREGEFKGEHVTAYLSNINCAINNYLVYTLGPKRNQLSQTLKNMCEWNPGSRFINLESCIEAYDRHAAYLKATYDIISDLITTIQNKK